MSDALRMELAPFGVKVITVQPGAVESSFGVRASEGIDRYRQGSLYSKIFDSIADRAGASQVGSMPAVEFAREVVEAVTAPSPSSIFRTGKQSFRLPVLGRLPSGVRDWIFSRRFRLDRLAVR